jgi:hypothetical protein
MPAEESGRGSSPTAVLLGGRTNANALQHRDPSWEPVASAKRHTMRRDVLIAAGESIPMPARLEIRNRNALG